LPSSERLVHNNEVDCGGGIVWINVNDPINGSSFRPHPLKPIPVQMQAASSKSAIGYLRPSIKATEAQSTDLRGPLAQACVTQRAAPTHLRPLGSSSPRKPCDEEGSDAKNDMTSKPRGFMAREEPLSLTLKTERNRRLDRHSEPCRK
jgi:hypothetical protein